MNWSNFIYSQILFLIFGIGAGFCSSAPIGPINLWYINSLLDHKIQRSYLFLIGVILMDFFFAMAAALGLISLKVVEEYNILISNIGSSFLFLFGFIGLFNLAKSKNEPLKKSKILHKTYSSKISLLLQGFLFCGLNPGFLLFWIFTVAQFNKISEFTFSLAVIPVFLIGIVIGDILWFYLLYKLVFKKLLNRKYSVIKYLRYFISITLILFGTYGFVSN